MVSLDEFQYRKRYGLHAMPTTLGEISEFTTFQYRKRYRLHAMVVSNMLGVEVPLFQYRKRYGLHAIRKGAFDLAAE